MQIKEIVEAALAASQAAAVKQNAALPAENARGFDCGFAWVTIKPARGPMVQYLKSINLGSTIDHSGGGYQIWYSRLHTLGTQSISVHEAAARAFADVLASHGVPASVGSRLD